MTIDQMITALRNEGFPTKELKAHQEVLAARALALVPFDDSFFAAPAEETTDEYFKGFRNGGLLAPDFQWRLLAVGRCFTLNDGQAQVLRSRYSVPMSNQATIINMDRDSRGIVTSITFHFASRGQKSRLRVGGQDLYDWKIASQEVMSLQESFTAHKPKKPTAKSRMDALADEWLNSEFGIGY